MGKLKRLVIMHNEIRGCEADNNEDFWDYVRRCGGRLGLTDEQLDALNQEGDR